MRASLFTFALLTLASSPGCGKGDLSLRLVKAGFDDPYAKTKSLLIRVVDQSFSELSRYRAKATAPAKLGLADAGDFRRVLVEGLDAGGQLVARGASRTIHLSKSTTGEELIPFSSLKVLAALPKSRALPGGIKIDGLLADWQSSPSILLDQAFTASGPKPAAKDLNAEVMFAWGKDKLYFALRVIDDCTTVIAGQSASACEATNTADRVTIGFDGADDGGGYGAGDFFLELSAGGVKTLAGAVERQQLQLAFGLLADNAGWTVEGSVTLAALGRTTLTPDQRVGLDLAVIDEDPQQPEPTVLRFSGAKIAAGAATPVDAMGTLGFANP